MDTYPRALIGVARRRARELPILAVLGPRQAGKSTLCRLAFGDRTLLSLEAHEVRALAHENPAAFLRAHPQGAVLDEVQRAPALLSELQVDVDRDPTPGRWILTGSQHFHLLESISQSLAGRAALLTLLPLAFDELGADRPATHEAACLYGGYPRIFDRKLDPAEWLDDYITAYVERAVRQVLRVTDLSTFQTFLGLCATRAGQVLNVASLGAEAGISHSTAKAWLSVLEASFVVFRLPPWFRNVGKRLTKSAKLYFYDVGLLCRLLRIRSADQVRQHPLQGALFENLMVVELLKSRLNRGYRAELCYYRDQSGREVDVIQDDPIEPALIEIQLAAPKDERDLRPLFDVERILQSSPIPPRSVRRYVLHGGCETGELGGAALVPWHAAGRLL